jgi:hypothetical protein
MIMESEHFQRALGRLEAAIERVERASAIAAPGRDDTRLAALEERHRILRDGAAQALARLDRLIDGAQGTPG